MSDGGAAIQPDAEETPAPFRPRGEYAGFKAFGSGEHAVLLAPGTIRALRSAAELAAREECTAGGLLYGCGYTDDQGDYLVIDGFLEAGPGESPDLPPADDPDAYTLPEAALELLRADAARQYPQAREAGWWRTLPELGDFGPGDFLTQQELVAPGGAGLLVYGSGAHWGTGYLGPDGHPPDVAGTLVVVPEDEGELEPDLAEDTSGAGPEVIDLAAGESLLDDGAELEPWAIPADETLPDLDGEVLSDDTVILPPVPALAAGPERGPGTELARRPPVLTPAPRPTGPRAMSPIRVPAAEWGTKAPNPGEEMPTDAKVVIFGLLVVPVIAAVIIGILLSSALIAFVVAVVCVLLVLGFVWFTRL
jgi:hypothetical protein